MTEPLSIEETFTAVTSKPTFAYDEVDPREVPPNFIAEAVCGSKYGSIVLPKCLGTFGIALSEFMDALRTNGIVCGINVDQGPIRIGGRLYTKGRDDLTEMLETVARLGYTFVTYDAYVEERFVSTESHGGFFEDIATFCVAATNHGLLPYVNLRPYIGDEVISGERQDRTSDNEAEVLSNYTNGLSGIGKGLLTALRTRVETGFHCVVGASMVEQGDLDGEDDSEAGAWETISFSTSQLMRALQMRGEMGMEATVGLKYLSAGLSFDAFRAKIDVLAEGESDSFPRSITLGRAGVEKATPSIESDREQAIRWFTACSNRLC